MSDKPLSNMVLLRIIMVLLRIIRDARSTVHAERQVLDALALRCNPAEKYVSWPSYAMLGRDTGLSLPTLQRAARSLEAKSLVRRQVRRDKSNKWWINVALLQQQADEVKAAEEAQKKPAEDDECPFDAPAAAATDSDSDDASAWMTGGAR